MVMRISGTTVDPIVGSILSDLVSPTSRRMPAVDIAEFGNKFEIVCELPGLKREDVKISVEGGTLTVSGERRHDGIPEGATVIRHETTKEPFSRSFDLPEEIDWNSITADLKDGILRIQVPKTEKSKPREIVIR